MDHTMPHRARRTAWLSCMMPLFAVLAGATSAVAAQPATPGLPPVEVIGTTPVPGLGLPLDQVPAPVLTATDRDLQRSGAIGLTDHLNREFGSVHVNEIQGNPHQVDLNYRGFTASPLLGTPQGLSVWMDGVRMNQPFGDIVSWDLIPRTAISTITLMPGSNPLFGLNALGGAIAIGTKDGRSHPGTSITAGYGSFARRGVEFEHGGANDLGLDVYVAGHLFSERGWRDDSPSALRQLFTKVGWRDAHTTARLTVALADNSLNGNGLQDERLLATDWRSVYTKPDITKNRSLLLNLALARDLGGDALLSGNVYHRHLRSSSANGDINEGSLDQPVYTLGEADRAALAAAGYRGYPESGADASNTPFPLWRCIAQALQNDEPGEACNGLINRTRTRQSQSGVNLQLGLGRELGGLRHQFTLGGGADTSRTSFLQTTQLGYLNPDRSVTGIDAFADGVSGGLLDGAPLDNRVDLTGRTRTVSLYASDTVSLSNALHLTVSGRYNSTAVRNRDGITPGGNAGSLDGDHRYSRFNPAAGLNWNPNRRFGTWLGYSESSRAPTSIELGCADPANPCRLPNAMAGDPPLAQVVARTLEAGARGVALADTLRWNAGVFRTETLDDILFVADDQAGFGYFRNVGKTLRRGLELGLGAQAGRLAWGAQYTFLEATYRSAETVNGASNSSNSTAAAGSPGLEGGTIEVRPGDRIPLIPRHLFKAWADYRVSDTVTVGLNTLALSGMTARGNENGAHQPDGRYYLGRGATAGYALLNLAASYRPTKPLRLFLQVANLFDRRYVTAGQLGPAGVTPAGAYIARPLPADANGDSPIQHATFVAPGAPRTVWMGVSYAF